MHVHTTPYAEHSSARGLADPETARPVRVGVGINHTVVPEGKDLHFPMAPSCEALLSFVDIPMVALTRPRYTAWCFFRRCGIPGNDTRRPWPCLQWALQPASALLYCSFPHLRPRPQGKRPGTHHPSPNLVVAQRFTRHSTHECMAAHLSPDLRLEHPQWFALRCAIDLRRFLRSALPQLIQQGRLPCRIVCG